MIVYRFKVALFDMKKIYRQIDISSEQTLEELHDIIFDAFDREDEHLYSFYLTRKPMRSTINIYNFPEYSIINEFDDDLSFRSNEKFDAEDTRIVSLKMKEKQKMYYIFDFGDSWWHEITLLSTSEIENISDLPKIVKKVGDSPPQYPDWDEDEE